jgi:hypothetical protein
MLVIDGFVIHRLVIDVTQNFVLFSLYSFFYLLVGKAILIRLSHKHDNAP